MNIQLFYKDEKYNQQKLVFLSILEAIEEAIKLNRPSIIVEIDRVIFTKEIDKDLKVSIEKFHCYDPTILRGWVKIKMGFELNEDVYFELGEERYGNAEVLEGTGCEVNGKYVEFSHQDEQQRLEMDEMDLDKEDLIKFMKLNGHRYFEL